MSKLKVLPEEAIISGFKGKVDFYLHDGVPCARRWPRSPGHRRAPAVESQWPAFAYAAALWSRMDPETQAAYNAMATGSGMTGRDLSMRAYLSGLYPYPTGI